MKIKRKIFLAALAIFALYMLIGCVGSPEPRNPMTAEGGPDPWWRTPYYADTPHAENPWLAFVPERSEVNKFDPWAYDDVQRYSVAPVASGRAVYLQRGREDKECESDKEIKQALRRNLQDFLQDHRRRTSPVY